MKNTQNFAFLTRVMCLLQANARQTATLQTCLWMEKKKKKERERHLQLFTDYRFGCNANPFVRHMFVRDKMLRFSCLLLRSIFYIPGRRRRKKNGIINLKGNQQLLILLSKVDSTTRIFSITNTYTHSHTNTLKWDEWNIWTNHALALASTLDT